MSVVSNKLPETAEQLSLPPLEVVYLKIVAGWDFFFFFSSPYSPTGLNWARRLPRQHNYGGVVVFTPIGRSRGAYPRTSTVIGWSRMTLLITGSLIGWSEPDVWERQKRSLSGWYWSLQNGVSTNWTGATEDWRRTVTRTTRLFRRGKLTAMLV